MKKKLLSLALALTMALALLPAPASAAELTILDWITVSDYIVTDKYESIDAPHFGEATKYLYYLGFVEYSDDLCCLLLPSDATITFQASEYSIWGIKLNELETDGSWTRWESVGSIDKTFTPASGTDTWNYARVQEEFPDCAYLICMTDSCDYMFDIMFVDEPSAPTSPVDPTPVDPAPVNPAPTAPSFTDVSDGAWYADSVAWAVDKGITNGTSNTTFSPGQTCSQAEILTFLWRAYGKPEWGAPPPMANVKASDYYYDSAAWACAAGMIDPDTFNPSDPCTRAQAVRFIWIVFRSLPAAASNFTDVDASADYAKAVDWAVENGITNGTSGTTFSPNKVCSRGEIVTFLYRAYNG